MPLAALPPWVWVLAAALAGGCGSSRPKEPPWPEEWPRLPAPTAGEDAHFLEAGLALERARDFEGALAHYAKLAPPAPGELPTPRRLRARLRMGRCLEELGRLSDAREAFEAVVRAPVAAPAAGDRGWDAEFALREQSEAGLGRTGGDAAALYLDALGASDEGTRLCAVLSLGRLRDPRARGPLALLAEDPAASADLRAAAAEALGAVGAGH
ncbi:MAG: hypothetical protein L0216_07475 [Planctomycetales bacterium]|nr:hypothetical protein [Planctomycetales bacterium]